MYVCAFVNQGAVITDTGLDLNGFHSVLINASWPGVMD